MSFVAHCPHCRREALAPDDDLGRSVACHGCRAEFVLVPDFSASPPPALWTPPAPSHEATPAAGQFEPSPLALMEPPAAADPEPRLAARRQPSLRESEGEAGDLAPVGAAAWILAGLASFFAVSSGVSASVTGLTFLVIPFALAGLLFGGVAVVQFVGRTAPLELAVPAVPAVGSALVLLLALLAPDFLSPQYEASRQRATDDPNLLRAVPANGELLPPDQLPAPGAGVDAARFALQRNGVRVRVQAAAAGPLRLEGKKPTFTKERYLAVDVVIQHVGGGAPISMVPWGKSSPRPVPNVALKIGGTAVGPADPGAAPVPGRWTSELHVSPGGAATARLLFPDSPLTDALTLELPAEAWGQTGTFPFRIPKTMVSVAPAAQSK